MQSAEVAKFALVDLPRRLSRRATSAALATDAVALVRPLALVGAAVRRCCLLEPDFGSVVVLAAVTGGLLFVAGARLRHFSCSSW